MTRMKALVFMTTWLAGIGLTGLGSVASDGAVDIWAAAATGKNEATKAARPNVAVLLAQHSGRSGMAKLKSTGYRGSYFVNGEIHVDTYGTPEGTPNVGGEPRFGSTASLQCQSTPFRFRMIERIGLLRAQKAEEWSKHESQYLAST